MLTFPLKFKKKIQSILINLENIHSIPPWATYSAMNPTSDVSIKILITAFVQNQKALLNKSQPFNSLISPKFRYSFTGCSHATFSLASSYTPSPIVCHDCLILWRMVIAGFCSSFIVNEITLKRAYK